MYIITGTAKHYAVVSTALGIVEERYVLEEAPAELGEMVQLYADDGMTELLYSFLANNPKAVYRLLTTDKDEETCDSDLLEMVNKEVERDDKLWCLLDSAECNLEANGYNLSGLYPTTD